MRPARAVLRALGASLFLCVVLVVPVTAIDKPLDSTSLTVVGLVAIAVGAFTYRHARHGRARGDAKD